MAKKSQAPDPTVKARVLMSCGWGECNEVVAVSAEEAAAGQEAGELDPDPSAVAYAESLAAAQVE